LCCLVPQSTRKPHCELTLPSACYQYESLIRIYCSKATRAHPFSHFCSRSLVERRLDMLPGLLTETLCSLKGGVERFAFSATWEFRPVQKPGTVPISASTPAAALLECDWELVPGSVSYFKVRARVCVFVLCLCVCKRTPQGACSLQSIICSKAALTYAQVSSCSRRLLNVVSQSRVSCCHCCRPKSVLTTLLMLRPLLARSGSSHLSHATCVASAYVLGR
jgi:hypothetical protein